MKTSIIRSLSLIALFILIASCSSDDSGGSLTGTNISISDIQGSWTVTSFVFDRAAEGPVLRIDLIDEGITASMTIQSNGRFTITSTVPGGGQDSISGQMSFDEDLLLVEFDDEPGEEEFFSIQLTNNDNNLLISGPAEYDFDEDGTDEPAIVSISLVRA